MIGIAVIVAIGQTLTAGMENFWWRLLAMVVISLVLAWPLRLVMRASDRRLERKMQEDVRSRG
ncbi:hypothetical protein EAE32_01675 [Kocuria tytonicola]|uniref:Uncharacterized protein n=1 Tax=Kocuria tytonicola TaxID=2055946 RepID=A0A3L9L6L2_9MICC|nr:hypothetical protein EAE32_01675 [Kocuria tytonicola]